MESITTNPNKWPLFFFPTNWNNKKKKSPSRRKIKTVRTSSVYRKNTNRSSLTWKILRKKSGDCYLNARKKKGMLKSQHL